MSATFHGRDIFAPIAAALAGGATLSDAGEPADPADLVTLVLPTAQVRAGALVAHVRYVDRFGNLQLNVGHEEVAQTGLRLGRAATVEPGDGSAHPVHYVRTFAAAVPDELLLYEDAQRRLALAVNHGDAASVSASASTTSCASARDEPLGTPRLHLRVTDSTNTRARGGGGRRPARTPSPPPSRAPGAGVRAGRGPLPPGARCSLVVRRPPPLLSLRRGWPPQAVGP